MTGVNLGDANAFAGDVTINNTHIERNKSIAEIKAENVAAYRDLCKNALADGIITSEESTQLEDARVRMGLTTDEAKQVMEAAKVAMIRHSKNALGKIQQVSLNQILKLMEAGKIENLRASMGRLEAMAQKYDADEVQCNYYMCLSALDPQECIARYANRNADNYWQAYWTAMAYINANRSGEAESIISDLEAWSEMPFGNIALLAAASSLSEYWNDREMTDFKDQALAFVEEGGGGCTDLIDNFTQALMLLMDTESVEQLAEFHDDFSFQLDYVLKGLTDKIKSAATKSAIPPMPKIDLLPED